MKKVCSQFVFVSLPCCQLEATGRKISDHVITRPNEVGPATSRQNTNTYGTGYSGGFEFFLNNTYILLRMYYCRKIECEVTMLS